MFVLETVNRERGKFMIAAGKSAILAATTIISRVSILRSDLTSCGGGKISDCGAESGALH
jgi:hypothetical protein